MKCNECEAFVREKETGCKVCSLKHIMQGKNMREAFCTRNSLMIHMEVEVLKEKEPDYYDRYEPLNEKKEGV